MPERSQSADKALIVVELSPTLSRFGPGRGSGRLLTKLLNTYARKLLQGLEIPAEPAISIRVAQDEDDFSLLPYQVQVNAQACRQFLMPIYDQHMTVDKFALLLHEILYQNRELFLSSQVAGQLLEQWFASKDGAPEVRPDGQAFLELLKGLLRRGLALSRGREPLQKHLESNGKVNIDAILEEALASVNNPSTQVWLGQNLSIDKDTLEAIRDEFQSYFFYAVGFIPPQIKVLQSDQLPGSAFQVQINDLYLPELKVDESPSQDKQMQILYTVAGKALEHASLLFTQDLLKLYLRNLEASYPNLIEAIRSHFSAIDLTIIFRSWVAESLSMRDLPGLLEGLLQINTSLQTDSESQSILFPGMADFYESQTINGDQSPSREAYVDALRLWNKRLVTDKFRQAGYNLPAIFLDEALEMRWEEMDEAKLRETERTPFLEILCFLIDSILKQEVNPALVTDFRLRRKIQKLIEIELPQIPVLNFDEIDASVSIETVGRIVWEDGQYLVETTRKGQAEEEEETGDRSDVHPNGSH